jgi:DNA-binding HxlR family transcriptional regulator
MQLRGVHDAMYVLNGKWTIAIIATLCLEGKKRFSEILKGVSGISGKVLSRELKDMEVNHLVHRTVLNTQPVTVLYELTEYGRQLKPVIESLGQWGISHRQKITGKQ